MRNRAKGSPSSESLERAKEVPGAEVFNVVVDSGVITLSGACKCMDVGLLLLLFLSCGEDVALVILMRGVSSVEMRWHSFISDAYLLFMLMMALVDGWDDILLMVQIELESV
jgi:hypothetical protein